MLARLAAFVACTMFVASSALAVPTLGAPPKADKALKAKKLVKSAGPKISKTAKVGKITKTAKLGKTAKVGKIHKAAKLGKTAKVGKIHKAAKLGKVVKAHKLSKAERATAARLAARKAASSKVAHVTPKHSTVVAKSSKLPSLPVSKTSTLSKTTAKTTSPVL